MRLSFDSIDEVREFVKGLKGTRGGKSGDTDDAGPSTGGQPGSSTAPPPLNPPSGAAGGFPGAGATSFSPPGAGFPTGPSAEVLALVNRIVPRIDAVIAGGQAADNVLTWFRQRCGADAANATIDQIKQVFLPKASVPELQDIAKLIAA